MFVLFTNKTKLFKNNLFLLRSAPSVSLGELESRFCFSVSKKVAKSAVVRNRLRRAGYRFLENYLPQIKSKSLVVFSYRLLPKNNEEIAKNLESILKESKLIK